MDKASTDINEMHLKSGDLVRFHDWGSGGYLFGLIMEKEDEIYHSKLNIWRPMDLYYLQAHGIDDVMVIDSLDKVEDYELSEFKDFLQELIKRNMYCPDADPLLKSINVA